MANTASILNDFRCWSQIVLIKKLSSEYIKDQERNARLRIRKSFK